jgi:hypothetical protein
MTTITMPMFFLLKENNSLLLGDASSASGDGADPSAVLAAKGWIESVSGRQTLASTGDGEKVPGRPLHRKLKLAPLTPAQILAWADAHYSRTGVWPSSKCGRVAGALRVTWSAINAALGAGLRGLAGGDSLYRLLRRERRIGERRGRPPQVARHRLVFRLRARGLSLSEVGRLLGISRQAAFQMLQRTSETASQEEG